jgi:parvulin-like peptidyl-prolyl isomerase
MTGLKIGDRLFDGDQLISALVQYKLLEPLVEQVVLDEAIQTVSFSKEELFYRMVGASDSPIPEDFTEFLTHWCQQKGITAAYFESVLLRDLKIEKFKQLHFTSKVESVFLNSKSDLDQIEYSLIQLTDVELAAELYFQLRDDNADFAQLAQSYSLGSERHAGGWVGPVPFSTLPVEAAEMLRQAKVGEICPPLMVADRVCLARLERLIPARLTEATYTQLTQKLYTQWLESQAKQLMAMPEAIAVLNSALPPQKSIDAGNGAGNAALPDSSADLSADLSADFTVDSPIEFEVI